MGVRVEVGGGRSLSIKKLGAVSQQNLFIQNQLYYLRLHIAKNIKIYKKVKELTGNIWGNNNKDSTHEV